MKDKILFLAAAIVILGITAAGVAYFANYGKEEMGTVPDEEAQELAEGLEKLAKSEEDFMPIEGYSAFIYLNEIDTLEASDFHGVETGEGKYEYRNQLLKFKRGNNDVITSAEETISLEGYKTLLVNLRARLGVETVEEVLEELDR